MKWLLRFLLWVTLLSVPCGFVSQAYQHALSRVAATVLAIGGHEVDIEDVQVMAPFDLAIFAAMCIASLSAPWATRRRALLIGLPVLLGIEVVTVVVGVGVSMIWPENSPQLGASLRLSGYVIETVPWVSAAVVWLLLLGAWELRIMPPPVRGRVARAEKRPPA